MHIPSEGVDADDHGASNDLLGHEVLRSASHVHLGERVEGRSDSAQLMFDQRNLKSGSVVGSGVCRSSVPGRHAVDGGIQLSKCGVNNDFG